MSQLSCSLSDGRPGNGVPLGSRDDITMVYGMGAANILKGTRAQTSLAKLKSVHTTRRVPHSVRVSELYANGWGRVRGNTTALLTRG